LLRNYRFSYFSSWRKVQSESFTATYELLPTDRNANLFYILIQAVIAVIYRYNSVKETGTSHDVMAASLAPKLFIVLIFLNLLTQVTLFKRVIYTHKDIVFKDPVGLIVDGLVSRRYVIIFPINYHRIIFSR
jgi:hypothetical protein